MKMFKKRLTEPVQDSVEPGSKYPVYDYAAEEEFIKAGDFEGWMNHIKDHPSNSKWGFTYIDATHIARQAARIEIEKARKEGMF